jgi:hypothetical protein
VPNGKLISRKSLTVPDCTEKDAGDQSFFDGIVEAMKKELPYYQTQNGLLYALREYTIIGGNASERFNRLSVDEIKQKLTLALKKKKIAGAIGDALYFADAANNFKWQSLLNDAGRTNFDISACESQSCLIGSCLCCLCQMENDKYGEFEPSDFGMQKFDSLLSDKKEKIKAKVKEIRVKIGKNDEKALDFTSIDKLGEHFDRPIALIEPNFGQFKIALKGKIFIGDLSDNADGNIFCCGRRVNVLTDNLEDEGIMFEMLGLSTSDDEVENSRRALLKMPNATIISRFLKDKNTLCVRRHPGHFQALPLAAA